MIKSSKFVIAQLIYFDYKHDSFEFDSHSKDLMKAADQHATYQFHTENEEFSVKILNILYLICSMMNYGRNKLVKTKKN